MHALEMWKKIYLDDFKEWLIIETCFKLRNQDLGTLENETCYKTGHVKGQLISKANCQAEDSSKKRTN
jgi:hypothetical protein